MYAVGPSIWQSGAPFGSAISRRMRARVVESRRLSNSFPFSDAQSGKHAPRLLPEYGVRIHRRADVEPRGARRVDLRDHRGRLAPVPTTRRLEMVDVELHAALARDAERFVHRLEQRVAPPSACA